MFDFVVIGSRLELKMVQEPYIVNLYFGILGAFFERQAGGERWFFSLAPSA